MVTNGSTMKLGEIREKAFDVVPVLASVSCITYSVFSAADASVDQGEPLGSSLAVVLGGCQKGLLKERRNGGLVDGNYVFHFDQENRRTYTHCTAFLRSTLTHPRCTIRFT